jgi:hypothetical protein
MTEKCMKRMIKLKNKQQGIKRFFVQKDISDIQPDDEDFLWVVDLARKGGQLSIPSGIELQQIQLKEADIASMRKSIKTKGLQTEAILSIGKELAMLNNDVSLMKDKVKDKERQINKVKVTRDLARRASFFHEANENFEVFAAWEVVLQSCLDLLQINPNRDDDLINEGLSIDLDGELVDEGNGNETVPIELEIDDAEDVELQVEVNENPFNGAQKARGERKKKVRNGCTTRMNKTKNGPLILKTTYLKTMKNAEEKGLLSSKDFTWSGGAVYCSYCNNRIRNARHIIQHAKGKKHVKKKAKAMSGLDKRCITQSIHAVTKACPNACSDDREKHYRMTALKTISIANISAGSLEDMRPFIEKNSKPGLLLGDTSNLVRDYAEPTLDTIVSDIRSLLDKSFPEFGLSLDGTPSFAEAECIIIRFVTKNFVIMELVVRVGLFHMHLKHEDLAHHIVDCIHKRLCLPVSD